MVDLKSHAGYLRQWGIIKQLRFRHKIYLCFNSMFQATPYLLNGALVLAVAVYVLAGAFAIRHIEATRTGFITKVIMLI